MNYTLILAAFVSSIISGTIGMGGGILLLAVMAQYYTLEALIPLHGAVQLGSNFSRVLMHFKSFNRKIMYRYLGGAIIGVILAYFIKIDIPNGPYKIGLGVFILGITFLPKLKINSKNIYKWPIVGLIATFMSLITGATGPLVAPFYLNESLNRIQLIATKAACQIWTHILKIGLFILGGFAFSKYLSFLAVMILTVFLGNYIGKHFLKKMSEKWFLNVFKILILVLALRMIIKGLLAMI